MMCHDVLLDPLGMAASQQILLLPQINPGNAHVAGNHLSSRSTGDWHYSPPLCLWPILLLHQLCVQARVFGTGQAPHCSRHG